MHTTNDKDGDSTLSRQRAIDAIFTPFSRSDEPGLVVGVAFEGEVIYRRGFGLASVASGLVNSPTTRMRIASTSKHFCCLATLLLCEDGIVDIDTSICSYFDGFLSTNSTPTVRQLMTHTSGLRCYLDLGMLSDGLSIQPEGSALESQLRQTSGNFLPGDKLIYCNGGYQLLSILIERMSGMPFEKFLEQRIFRPLGMWDTISVPGNFQLERGMATLHVPNPSGGWQQGIWPSEELRGEGGIVSTVDDMLIWLAHMRASQKIVGSPETWLQMFQPATLNNGMKTNYALGLICNEYRGIQVIHHAGSVFGGTCQMITVPDHGIDVIIMTNGVPINPAELAYKVIDVIAEDRLSSCDKSSIASEDFSSVIGTRYYSENSGVGFAFSQLPEGSLGLSYQNFLPLPLKRQGASGDLGIGIEDIALGPLVIQAAGISPLEEMPDTISLSEGGHIEQFDKMPEIPPKNSEIFDTLIGRYISNDLDIEGEFSLSGEDLLFSICGKRGGNTLKIEAWSPDVLSWTSLKFQLIRGLMSIRRDKYGFVVGLQVNTLRTRGLEFKRLV